MFDTPKIPKWPEVPSRDVLNAHYKALYPDYDWEPHRDYIELAKECCWFYDDVINKRSPRWLSLTGQSGTGKTEWAKRIRGALKERKCFVQLWDWSTVCEYLGKGNWDLLEHLENVDILIIDEIGKTDWKAGNEKLSHLCDKRLNKWTILISNKYQHDIAENLDVRVASRMTRDFNRLAVMTKDCPDYHNFIKKNDK